MFWPIIYSSISQSPSGDNPCVGMAQRRDLEQWANANAHSISAESRSAIPPAREKRERERFPSKEVLRVAQSAAHATSAESLQQLGVINSAAHF